MSAGSFMAHVNGKKMANFEINRSN
jgi:hypothetical protein